MSDTSQQAQQALDERIRLDTLEKSLRFTQFTIDHVATPVFWADAEGRFFNVNDAACRLSGYSREELFALTVSDINPEIPPEAWGAVWSGIKQRGTLVMESILRRKDGGEIPISVDSNLLQAEGGECSCTFILDITARKRAEQIQQESESRCRAIFKQLHLQIERMPLAYVLFDSDFRATDWNPAAERIFGYSKEEVLGEDFSWEKLVPPAFRRQMKELLARIRRGDMSAHSINDNLTKDGRTIICEWINTPLESETGEFMGLMCLAQDLTERKRLEGQLRQSQKLEAVGLLAGGIAHEFNNLLQAITGYTRFAIDGLPPETQSYQDLQSVLTSAERATELTRQLLSFGRRQVLQRDRLDPNQVVGDLVKMLRRLIGDDIDIQTRLAPGIAAIHADAGQMQQMLLNLCLNARDAMPAGGRLNVCTEDIVLSEDFCAGHAGARPGPHVLLSVADNGCGMSPEVKLHIFEPFFTTKELGKGTGLGLAMVYGMVEQHGGIIHVDSEPDAGTMFRIYLPVAASDETRPAPAIGPRSTGGSETILLVEDDSIVRTFMARVLENAGYKTLTAANGADGLRVFIENSKTIALAVLDVVMPRMGGHALFQRLRAREPDLRVVFFTSHEPGVDGTGTIQHQELPLLRKPIAPATLLQTVRAVLDTPKDEWRAAAIPIRIEVVQAAIGGLETVNSNERETR